MWSFRHPLQWFSEQTWSRRRMGSTPLPWQSDGIVISLSCVCIMSDSSVFMSDKYECSHQPIIIVLSLTAAVQGPGGGRVMNDRKQIADIKIQTNKPLSLTLPEGSIYLSRPKPMPMIAVAMINKIECTWKHINCRLKIYFVCLLVQQNIMSEPIER